MKKIFTAEARWNESKEYWQINVMVDGLRRSFYSKTPGKRGKKEAEAKAQEWADTRRTGDMPLQKATDLWLESKRRNVSTTTYDSIESAVRIWMLPPTMRNKRLSRIAPQEWQDILDTAATMGRSVQTVGKLRKRILEFADFCRSSRWMLEYPEDLRVNGGKPTAEKAILQPDALNVVFSVDTISRHGKRTRCWHINAFRLACLTGLRRGEICALRWDAITDTTLSVVAATNGKGITTKGKTDNAQREFALNPSIRAVLDDQRSFLRSRGIISPWVFPNIGGEQETATKFYKDWKKYAADNGLDERVSFHCLRHTMVSLYKDTVPTALLKQVVGHSAAMDTIGHYGHALTSDAAETAALMENTVHAYIH